MQLVRNQGTFEFSENQTKTIKLTKDSTFKKLSLRLKGDITISGGTTDGSVVSFSPVSIIKKIELILNGKDTVFSLSGIDLYRLNFLLSLQKNELVTLAGAGAQANTKVYANIDINFKLLKSYVEEIALLNGRLYSDITLQITYGDDSDIITGGDRDTVINEMDVDIISVEETALINKKILAVKKLTTIFEQVIAASGDVKFELPIGNIYYMIMIQIYDNAIPDNALCNTVKLDMNGVNTVFSAGFNQLRNKMQKEWDLKFSELYDGQLMLLIDNERNLRNSIDSSALNSLNLTLNFNSPTGTAKAFIMPFELITG